MSSSSGSSVSSGSRSPLLLPLVFGNLFGHVALSGGRVTTSLFALHEGASESLVGVLIGVYGALPMLGAIAMGRWVDRVGPATPMRIGILANVAGVALAALAPSVPMLFATAVLCGLGFNLLTVAAQYAVGHLPAASEKDRIANFGWLALGHSSSTVCGPLLVGVLIDHVGYRAAYIVITASAAVATAIVFANARRLASLRASPSPSPASASSRARGGAWELLATPAIRRIYIVGVILAIAWDLFTFLMPILGHRQSFSASTIGTILSVFAAGTFGVRLVQAHIARRFSEWQTLRAAIVVVVSVYVFLPLTHAVSSFFLLAFALGAAVGCTQPNMLSLLHVVAPPGRGAEAVGLRAVFGNASGVFVPILFGATAASLGVVPVFWGVAALVASALPVAHRAARDHGAIDGIGAIGAIDGIDGIDGIDAIGAPRTRT